MDKLKDIRSKFHRNLPMLVGVCLSLYFSYHSVSGHRSYSRLVDLNSSLQEKTQALQGLEQEVAVLESKVRMMRPDSLSVDMLDEQASLILGYARIGDIVVLGD